jgi:O-antigen/teichoic acid export membrane protein
MARGGETEKERLDRNLDQLVTQLRVAMPGVQILFAFLLSVPFAARFDQTTQFQRDVYLVSLVAAGVATAFFIAPTAYHRMTFRRGEKRHLVFSANRWTLIGLVALAVAMDAAVLLVADFLFDAVLAIALAAAMGALFTGLWFVFPLVRRLPREENG